jgi:DNA polymerase III delta prime subunit
MMKRISGSSIWVEKYRPQTLDDVILPKKMMDYFRQIAGSGEIPNMIFGGSAGRGKTSVAVSLLNDVDADMLFINASLQNNMDTLRYTINSYAMTSSMTDSQKVVFLDEADRLKPEVQDGLKGLIEQTEANCRFIFTTNNISKIIDPIKSRCQYIDFNSGQADTQELMVSYFKRMCWILENEMVPFEKPALAEFVKLKYPDFRMILNELQKYVKMHGKVDEAVLRSVDGTLLRDLVEELKNKKFNAVRKLASELDPDSFYGNFYDQIDTCLQDSCKADVIIILAKFAYETSLSVNRELSLVACLVEIMKNAIWK